MCIKGPGFRFMCKQGILNAHVQQTQARKHRCCCCKELCNAWHCLCLQQASWVLLAVLLSTCCISLYPTHLISECRQQVWQQAGLMVHALTQAGHPVTQGQHPLKA